MDKRGIERKNPEVETEIGGVVGVVIENVIDQIGEEVEATNVEIDQGLKHKNKGKGKKVNTCWLP